MGTIIAALLGALATASVTHILAVRREKDRLKEERKREDRREQRDKQREEDKERKELLGLLKLVHAEIVNNLELLKTMGSERRVNVIQDTSKPKRGSDTLEAPKLSSSAWTQARTRISTIMENEERLRTLVSGYAALDVFKNLLMNPSTDNLSEEAYVALAKSAESHQWLAFEVCQKETGKFWTWNKGMLVSESDEEFEKAKQEALEEEQE